MTIDSINRRDFVRRTGALAGTSVLRLGMPALVAAAQAACSARDAGESYSTLSADEAREFDAITARILPTTDTPGARDAGVVHFIDRVLGNEFAALHSMVAGAMQQFQAGVAEAFPGVERFSDLSEDVQDRYLADNDQTPFFDIAHTLTMMGFFAMSSYGGNRDNVGWKLIGFEGHGAWQPPFGYYDAEYTGSAGDGN